jgi:hypothetical protein
MCTRLVRMIAESGVTVEHRGLSVACDLLPQRGQSVSAATTFSICAVCSLCRRSASAYRAAHSSCCFSKPSSDSLIYESKPFGKM